MVGITFASVKAQACRRVCGACYQRKFWSMTALKHLFEHSQADSYVKKVLKIVILSLTLTKKSIVIIWRHVKTKNATVPVLLVTSVLLGKNSFELYPLRRNKLWTYLFSMSIWLYQRYLMSYTKLFNMWTTRNMRKRTTDLISHCFVLSIQHNKRMSFDFDCHEYGDYECGKCQKDSMSIWNSSIKCRVPVSSSWPYLERAWHKFSETVVWK